MKVYATGMRAFLTFTTMHNIPKINTSMIPLCNEEILKFFVAHCHANLHITSTTIKSYLAGVRNHYITHGLGNPLCTNEGEPYHQLELIIRGIKKTEVPRRVSRQPVTPDILLAICRSLQKGLFGPYMDQMMQAACLLAFFGFLRCGEFTTYSKVYDPETHLSLQDITFMDEKELRVNLKVSKTDPFRKGCSIRIYKTNHKTLCPYTAIFRYLVTRKSVSYSPEDPLFLLPGHVALSRQVFLNLLDQACQASGIKTQDITGHSFRIGAATAAASVKTPDHLIQTLGRWQSSCYKRYIKTPGTLIQQTQCRMAKSAITSSQTLM